MLSLSSLPTVDWITVIQLLIAFYVAKFYYKYFTRQSPLPGPFPLPLIGNIHQVRLNPSQYAVDHQKEFGNMFEIWVGSRRFIFLCHGSLLDQVYISSSTCKFFPRIQYEKVTDIESGIALNNDYQSWKVDRKFVTQSLMSPRFLRSFTHTTQSLFNENESYWDKKEYHIDFAKWVKCFTTDITLQTVTRKPSYNLYSYLFGEEHSDPVIREEIKKSNRLISAIQDGLMFMMFQTLLPSFVRNYVPGIYHLNKRYTNNVKWFDETILDIVKKRRSEIEESNDKDIGSNLLDVLMTLNTPFDPNGYDENEAPMTDQEVCRVVKDVCGTGTDTTGNTFCFTVWQLFHHPEVLARFQQEIKEILGDDITRKINYEDLEKFTYLDAIIKESTRIIPLLPVSARYSTDDSEIGGKQWGPNTSFFIHHELIQKSPDCWKDPDQFIPERFLKGADPIVKNSFVPFGGGMRICPGRHMATIELKTLFILLFRKYEVELVDKESKKPKIKYMGLNTCSELKVILRPRKS